MTTATEPRQLLSGWCGQHCAGCTSSRCQHHCHPANRPRNKGNQRGVETVEWDNGSNRKAASRRCANTVAPGGLADERTVD